MMARAVAALLTLACCAVAQGAANAPSHIAVIGAGFSGLTAALELRALGHRVTVIERLPRVGGRANHFSVSVAASDTPPQELAFDEGPSWYAMPDLIDAVFARYHARGRADLYNVTRLASSYRVRLAGNRTIDVPGTLEGLLALVGAERAPMLRRFFAEAQFKYEQATVDWLWRPMVSFAELLSPNLALAALTTDMFGSYEAHLRRHVCCTPPDAALSDDDIVALLKWPVIFLGASPRHAPAMYSMITYALHALGIWVPDGGMSTPARALAAVAERNGVAFRLGAEVTAVRIAPDDAQRITHVCVGAECDAFDGVVGAADYHHLEQHVLPPHLRRYDAAFWQQATLSPSCLIFHVGFPAGAASTRALFDAVLAHHTYFFDRDLDAYLDAVFVRRVALDADETRDAVFYVSAPFPPALMVLVPVAHTVNGTDTEAVRARILDLVLRRLGDALPPPLNHVPLQPSYSRSYGPANYTHEYNALRGNAFGLANTLQQSLLWRPSIDGLASNLVFAGHMTTPGPGVPPAMVSGIAAARVLHAKLAARKIEQHNSFISAWMFRLTGVAPDALFSSLLYIALLALAPPIALLALHALWRSLSHLPTRSEFACVWRFYAHGSSFFAASTLLSLPAFRDTACMYALFRAADDCVDQVGVAAAQRRAQLARFEAAFWRGLRTGDAITGAELATVDSVLPAVVASCRRLAYPHRLFETFFAAMRADCASDEGTLVCRTMQDTCDYMEGSAAVIGEFMLPILVAGAAPAGDAARLVETAQALGNAFQLTNMIRDVEEDRLLGRVYLPGDVRSGDAARIEAAITTANAYYALADQGIAMLPTHNNARAVVRLARHMYAGIHDAIRAQHYDLHTRARVSNAAKLAMAVQHLGVASTARLVATHLIAACTAWTFQYAAPLVVVLLAYFAPLYARAELSYAQFHYVFTLPALVLLWAAAIAGATDAPFIGRFARWALVMCVVATAYTTPWDNALVWANVWGYPSERPLWGTLGAVPLEEYAFFSIETLLVAGMWLAAFPPKRLLLPPTSTTASAAHVDGAAHNLGRLVLAALFGVGVYLYPLYMGRILTWAVPVLVVQWEFGHRALCAHAAPLAAVVVLASVQLCMLDCWAIKDGIWGINPEHMLVPAALTFGLPLEEAIFFVLTACMCAGGLTLAMLVDQYRHTRNSVHAHAGNAVNAHGRGVRVSWRDALAAVHEWRAAVDAGLNRAPVELVAPPASSCASSLPLWHSLLTSALALAATAYHVVWRGDNESTLSSDVALLLVGVVAIGMPHGALDAVSLRATHVPAYVGGVVATLAVWQLSAELALVAFLLASIVHFGEGDVQRPIASLAIAAEVCARGGMFLVAVARHPGACYQVFVWLVGDAAGAERIIAVVLDYFAPLHTLCLVSVAFDVLRRLHDMRACAALLELCAVYALFYATPPLFAFGVYFNGVHATRHVVRIYNAASSSSSSSLLATALQYSLPVVAVCACIIAWSAPVALHLDAAIASVTPTALRTAFAALAALTTPHAVFVWREYHS